MRERLLNLDAEFVGSVNVVGERSYRRQGSELQGAQGVMFQCPKCAEGKEQGEEDGRRHYKGAHYIVAWFANPVGAPVAPPEIMPGITARWTQSGSGLHDLSLTPSILLPGAGCQWHGFVTNGEAHE